MEAASAAVAAGVAKVKLEFIYDYMGRRVRKSFWTWDATHYDYTSGQKFLYDGWRLVAELGESNTPTRKYVWGLDLSGTLQGVGGIGGLTMLVQQLGTETEAAIYFPAFDGNGNVTALVNSDNGAAEFGQISRTPAASTQVSYQQRKQDRACGYADADQENAVDIRRHADPLSTKPVTKKQERT